MSDFAKELAKHDVALKQLEEEEHKKKKFLKQKILFDNFQICLLASILITIWPLAPSGNFFNNWLSIIYFYPIGMLLWSFQNNKY